MRWLTNGYTLEAMMCRKQTSTAQRIHPHLTPSENGGRDGPNWQPQHSALTLISE